MKPIVAIVGRPNVGKSRLFNQLCEQDRAIVHDFEGVTRDRQYADADWFGKAYTIIDTGGFVPVTDEPMLTSMRAQAQLAMEEADVIIFMMDGRAGLLTGDRDIANMLRETDKPVFYAVNKADDLKRRDEMLSEFYQLGVDVYAISAEHGHGVDAMMDDVAEHLTMFEGEPEDDPTIRIAVVGKPNAGKSSTVNALLGEERLLTSDEPGTTRDAIDTLIEHEDRRYLVIDTAGLRRKASISQKLEEYSVVQAIRSIDRADIVLFVLDAVEGVTQQDKKIASVAANRGRGVVVVVNKWDLVDKATETAGEFVKEFHYQVPFLDWAPIVFTSALTGQRVQKILPLVEQVFDQYTARVKTSDVNKFMEQVVVRHSPPVHRNRRLKFYYASQVATRPPTFMFVVNQPGGLAPSYRRFLVNQIREEFGFHGTPIKTVVRARKGHEREE